MLPVGLAWSTASAWIARLLCNPSVSTHAPLYRCAPPLQCVCRPPACLRVRTAGGRAARVCCVSQNSAQHGQTEDGQPEVNSRRGHHLSACVHNHPQVSLQQYWHMASWAVMAAHEWLSHGPSWIAPVLQRFVPYPCPAHEVCSQLCSAVFRAYHASQQASPLPQDNTDPHVKPSASGRPVTDYQAGLAG